MEDDEQQPRGTKRCAPEKEEACEKDDDTSQDTTRPVKRRRRSYGVRENRRNLTRNEDGTFTCAFPGCGKIFTTTNHFGNHYGYHLPRIPCMLVGCERSFTDSCYHRPHVRRHAEGKCAFEPDDDEGFKCRLCYAMFDDMVTAAQHCLKEHTFGRVVRTPSGIFRRPYGAKTVTTDDATTRADVSAALTAPKQFCRKDSTDGRIHCTFPGCSAHFAERCGWSEHFGVHLPPVSCMLVGCSAVFTNNQAHRAHLRAHVAGKHTFEAKDDNSFECRKCNERFSDLVATAKHCLGHTKHRKRKEDINTHTTEVPPPAEPPRVAEVKQNVRNTADEKWKNEDDEEIELRKLSDIVGHPGYYVSQCGGIYYRLKHGYRKMKEQSVNGYRHVTIRAKGCNKTHNFRVHRLVASAWLTNEMDLPIVNHKDGNRSNNQVTNLEWVTYKGNWQHARETGLWKPKNNGRCVAIVDATSGNLVGSYSNILEATKATDVSEARLRRALKLNVETLENYRVNYTDIAKPASCDEEWRTVENDSVSADLGYQVSNTGRVRNRRGNELKPRKGSGGHLSVYLSMGKRNATVGLQVSRLVAAAFVPNPDPDNLLCVDHIDTDTNNNYSSNLRWVTQRQNLLNPLSLKKHFRPVDQLDEDGKVLRTFESVLQAAQFITTSLSGRRTDNVRTSISKCLTGNLQSCYGHRWRRAVQTNASSSDETMLATLNSSNTG